ncbi:hypothetical protein B0H21DRAFT_753205 [Amylocystis lapponica]|nr:hypothetical protein B0H21DRAFT_753205 [Amylocystis lapponica]
MSCKSRGRMLLHVANIYILLFHAAAMSAALALARSSRRLASTSAPATHSEPNTHFRITLRRSAISLPANIKGTLVALGIHRRMQTVYHLHNPETAGKILRNVPASAVRTKTEQRRERRATRGYAVVGSSLKALDL